MTRRHLLVLGGVGIFIVLLSLWFVLRGFRGGQEAQPLPRARVGRHVVWLPLSGLAGEVQVTLWDAHGQALSYEDVVVAFQGNGEVRQGHLLLIGDFSSLTPRYAEVRIRGQRVTYLLEPASPPQGRVKGQRVLLRDALLGSQTAVLFACFSLPDVRDWRPQVRLATPQGRWVPFYEHLYRAREAFARREGCFIFLFAPREGTISKPAAEWTLHTSALVLDRQQCLTAEEKRRVEAWASSRGPLPVAFVEWQDAPDAWPYRWCPAPPSGPEVTPSPDVFALWEGAYRTLFTQPVGEDLTFTLAAPLGEE